MKKDSTLQLCGLGARPPDETTLETLEALRRSSVVYFEPKEKALLRWLRPWCPRVRATGPLGRTDTERAEAILRSTDAGLVSVAVWGHPLLSSGLGLELARRAPGRGVRLCVPGAVSPVGSAFARARAFFGGDYGHHGIQACTPEEAAGEGFELDGGLPVVLYGDGASPSWEGAALRLARLFPRGRARVFAAGRADADSGLGGLAREVAGASGAVVLVEPARAPAKERRGR